MLLFALLLVSGCAATTGRLPAPATSAPRTSGSTAPGSPAPDSAGQGLPAAFRRLPSTSGRLLETTLTGRASGVTMRVWVWLPPQYDQPAFAQSRFPALMLYPGGAGVRHNAWAGPSLGAQEDIAAGSTSGAVTPFILVMPQMQLSADLDTECADLPGRPKVGTFLAQDVRAMVEADFRVITDRRGWGAAGVSSGAYCAARLVFNHPDQYAAVAVLDGYFTIDTPLAGASDPSVRAEDPWALAVTSPPPVSVLVWTGDGPDLTRAQAFMKRVRPPTQAELKLLPGGQHLTTDAARMVPSTLEFLTGHLMPVMPIG